MALPDYKRPFEQADFRGYFKWTPTLSKRLGISVFYHACHENELQSVLFEDKLLLRSEWQLDLPTHGLWKVPGIWCGLNWFVHGNRYGPYVVEIPVARLEGRTFMAFRRKSERSRYFFVQYESMIPVFVFGPKKTTWRTVNPVKYFTENGEKEYHFERGAIYDLVLIQEVPFQGASITPVAHPGCVPGKCAGMTKSESIAGLRAIAEHNFSRWMSHSGEYQAMNERFFGLLEGCEVKLPAPNDFSL